MANESVSQKSRRIVESMKEYALHHLEADLSLSCMSRITGRSASNLSKIFKQVTGCGYIEYVVEQRMHRAVELLQAQSPLKMEDIAAAVGYNTSSYFIHVFHETFGLTPSEYRRDYLIEEK